MKPWVEIRRSLRLALPPAVEPLSYAEAKAFLRLPDDSDQAYVTSLAVAAREKVEGDTGRRLITQEWDLTCDSFPSDAILVPIAPLASVSSIKTVSPAGVESIVAATNYQVDTSNTAPCIYRSDLGAWPCDLRRHQAVVVRLVVGYGASRDVPSSLLRAMEQLVAHWYMHRTQSAFMPLPRWFGYDALIDPYRLMGMA